jgi:hypothetical protein
MNEPILTDAVIHVSGSLVSASTIAIVTFGSAKEGVIL